MRAKFVNELRSGSNPRAGNPDLVGKVFKYHWANTRIEYYMVLDDAYTPKGERNKWHLTLTLAKYSKGRWLVPYPLKTIYYLKGERQGSQRSGYVDLNTCTPISEKDKQRLIKLFQRPRFLSYLEEIKEDEGFVPDFLEHLLDDDFNEDEMRNDWYDPQEDSPDRNIVTGRNNFDLDQDIYDRNPDYDI